MDNKQKIALKNKFNEISKCLTRISSERDLIKEILSDIKQEFNMPPKIARNIAKIHHKRNFSEVVSDNSEVAETYEELFLSQLNPLRPDQKDLFGVREEDL